jgi:tetratricopeptide (TPR) repeat protein
MKSFSRTVCSIALLMAASILARVDIAVAQDFADDCRGKPPADAIAACNRWIQRSPRDPKAHLFSGIKHFLLEEYDRALADYTATIKLDPKEDWAFNGRGRIYTIRGQYDLAIAEFDAAIKVAPKRAAPYLSNRGLAFIGKGDIDRAIRDFGEARKFGIDPFDLYRRGLAHFSDAAYSAAAADLIESIQDARSLRLDVDGFAVVALFLARTRAGDSSARNELQNAASELKIRDSTTTLVRMYLEQMSPDQALSRAPKDGVCATRFFVAHWHLLRGERDRAAELLKIVDSGCARHDYGYDARAELTRMGL